MKTDLLCPNHESFPNVAAARARILATAERDSQFYQSMARLGFRPGNGVVVIETLGRTDLARVVSGFAKIAGPSFEDTDCLNSLQALPGHRAVVDAETPSFGQWGGRRALVGAVIEAIAGKTDRITFASGIKGGQHIWVMQSNGNMIGLTAKGLTYVVVIPETLGGGLLAISQDGGVQKLTPDSVLADNYDAWQNVTVQGQGQISGLDTRFEGSLLTARCADGRLAALECGEIRRGEIRIIDRTSEAVAATPRGRIAFEGHKYGLFGVQIGGRPVTVIGPMTGQGLPHASIAAYAS